MTEHEEKNFLICGSAETEPHIPNSTLADCERCGEKVWLAPSGVITRDEMECIVLCMDCGLKEMQEKAASGEEVQVAPISERQRKEVIDALLRDAL